MKTNPQLIYVTTMIVGASHSIFPLFATASALSMLSPSQSPAMSQKVQEHKIGNLPLVLTTWERADKLKDKMEIDKNSGVDSKDNYDFIVVGAGTAGSIVAVRLSEHFLVLLLEAGCQPHTNHDNSAISMIMTNHSETDWMYSSVVQNETYFLCPDKVR